MPPLNLPEPHAPGCPVAHTPTPQQQAVIDRREGTTVVLAAVGSGKTTTLSHRLAAALTDAPPVRPERVLAVTFTNRAARHMRESLAEVIGENTAQRVILSTFHALCVRILRSDPPGAGLSADFRILDEDDTAELLGELSVSAPTKAMYALGRAASAVPLGGCHVADWHQGLVGGFDWGPAYARALQLRGAVDFAGLVYLTRALLTDVPDAAGRWSTAFDLVQVDEVQDTHVSEYEVLRVLAAQARSLCLVGDLDQTIYSWRGSAPKALLHHLQADFGPVETLSLTRNFRSTRRLLAVADAVAAEMPDRASDMEPATSSVDGAWPTLTTYSTQDREAEGIARHIGRAVAAGTDPERIAVLVRTHADLATIAAALAQAAVPHTTLEQFKFYRRAEIKDALAVARLVSDPHDDVAARRVARRMVRRVGPATLARIVDEGAPAGLRLTDLLDEDTVQQGDPMWRLESADCVVLDTETTGFDPDSDEVIEVAAVRLRGGKVSDDPQDRFEALLRNTVPVGASEEVHHISDARLREEGEDAAVVLRRLADWMGRQSIAGHNVAFDVRMLQGHARRLGIELPLTVRFDTLHYARRLVHHTRDHKLGTLVEALDIEHIPTHRALDDVLATAQLAAVLAERGRTGRARRWAVLQREAPLFAKLRAALDRWRRAGLRPGKLVRRICDEVLRYRGDDGPARIARVHELSRRLDALDRPELSASQALQQTLDRAALVREVDALATTPGVRVLTIHQSKGLEFDHVYVPALTEPGLPSWFALRDSTPDDSSPIDEERRLFYVAITRARLQLHLSHHQRGRRGSRRPSRFLAGLTQVVRPIAGP